MIVVATYAAVSLVLQGLGWVPLRRPLYENARVYDRALFASNSPVLQRAAGWLWEPRSDTRWRNVSTNRAGFRGPELRQDGSLRIAILGDSMTFGAGLPETGTWPASLQHFFDLKGERVEVVNAGVPCHTIVQGLEWYRGRVRRLRPKIVIVAHNGIEEATDAIDGIGDLERVERSRRLLSRIESALARLCVVRSVAAALKGDDSAVPAGARRPRVTPEEYRSSLTALLGEIRADRANALVVRGFRPGARGADAAVLQQLDEVTREVTTREGDVLLSLEEDPQWFLHDGRLTPVGAKTLALRVENQLTDLHWITPPRASVDGSGQRR